MMNSIVKVKDFNLEQTLECGQCFRFKKYSDNHYIVNAKDKALEVKQEDDNLIFYNISKEEEKNWIEYFDLDRDYSEIKDYIISREPKMKEIIEAGSGIRILNQDFFETLISFIISQNKQIPQIKQVINNLAIKYGEELSDDNYAFPTMERLSQVTEEEFRESKAGFRAKYLVDACEKVKSGLINEKDLLTLSNEEILNELCTIKGVGVKVSNCVMLFGLGRKEAFPIDVWIKRIMEEIYFKKETKLDIIQKFAEEKFGSYGGFAQQYLFYYSRIK
ncbi:MAG TPA: DNA glycosylase [Clostridiales bacterium]|nr:DNA glycosylase [Clostridiales bacterium]